MIEFEWEDKASDELADLYVSATFEERESIAGLVEQFQRDIKRDPLEVGEARVPYVRVVVRDHWSSGSA